VPRKAGDKIEKMSTSKTILNWNERKDILKQKFGSLTDTDLMYAEGKKEIMLVKLQIKLGKSKDELIRIIASL
jgi:uncharacterized protein YjbJ (UPF0337 family)